MTSKSSGQIDQITDAETADSRWKGLYKVGGAAALLIVVFTVIQTIAFIASPPPSTVIGWFTLFQDNRLVGLIDMDLLLVADNILAIPIFLALCVALRRASASFMAIAATLGFVGIAVYFASNQAFSMLSFSDQYAAATTDAQKALFLAAGQATIAIHNNASYQGTGIYISFFLVSVAGLIISAVMLRSNIFSKVTAYVGILANVFGLGYYITLAFAPAIVYLPLSASGLFWLIWYILIGRRLLQLGQGTWKGEANQIGAATGGKEDSNE